jgi:hypothetical protein
MRMLSMNLLAIRHRVRRRKTNHFGKATEYSGVAKDSRVFVRLQLPDIGDDLIAGQSFGSTSILATWTAVRNCYPRKCIRVETQLQRSREETFQ